MKEIALVGNPNSGKSSLFNHLTGLKQRIGNYPGVTVDRKVGAIYSSKYGKMQLTDLPGTYSLYPQSKEDAIVLQELFRLIPKREDVLLAYVADVTNLLRSLVFFSQLQHLGFPMMLVLTMNDELDMAYSNVDLKKLQEELKVPVLTVNGKTGSGLNKLKRAFDESFDVPSTEPFPLDQEEAQVIESIRETYQFTSDFEAWLTLVNRPEFVLDHKGTGFNQDDNPFTPAQKMLFQRKDTSWRYDNLEHLVKRAKLSGKKKKEALRSKFDRVLTHKVWGYAILLGILFLVFQVIFSIATIPMDLIDGFFARLSTWVKMIIPEGWVSHLLAEGVIPGIGGVVIFIPQIALLFFFLNLLEQSGYMSRAVFIMDKLMRKLGLDGRSVVPLMSGVACAIPAIMATRNINSWKERLITILVVPFMTCSARLPVYTILIALVVPENFWLGVFNWQGLVLLGLYLLGLFAALFTAWILKFILKSQDKSIMVMEMPNYKLPHWKNVALSMWESTKSFVFDAGKIIFAISIVLWFLSSYGPSDIGLTKKSEIQNVEITESAKQAIQLEQSFAGHLGKFIEPAIEPLGYDWKIGIALITSFAAREVFVGSMATIYSVGHYTDDESTIKEKLASEINPHTGKPRFSLAVAISMLLFYAFAMQCMSTLAAVKRETKGWKWPIIQLIAMTTIAYFSAFAAYQLLK